MSFQPILPIGGYAGWSLLSRTKAAQTAAFNARPDMVNETEYFRDNIGAIDTAEQLVDDRRLLRVALSAFGLSEDIDAKAFIKRILEDGSISPDALANKLTDRRYQAFARAFGFGDLNVPNTKRDSTVAHMVNLYEQRSFEASVGDIDDSFRLALNLDRGLADIVGEDSSEAAKWFQIMGDAPLRAVFERALSLPKSFASLDIDQQLGVFEDRTKQVFGITELADFAAQDQREKLIQRFLLMDQLDQSAVMSSTQIAVTLLAH
ncbi:MAG: DUF1217 domain-containing protein [Cognatishimia sp.]